jgi:predicted HD phosphohydrolase
MVAVQSSLTRRGGGDAAPFPALKNRAKIRSPRRGGFMYRLHLTHTRLREELIMPFARMDQAQPEDYAIIGDALNKRQARMPEIIKSMLRQLQEQVDGFAVDQLEHSLQTATRALRAGASEEMVVAAVCHDIGKVVSVLNHGAITAEIINPYVSHETYEIIRTHQQFQSRYYNRALGRDPDERRQYANEPWYELACRFSDEWDQTAFDPSYDSLPLEHFEPMIDRVFAHPHQSVLEPISS